MNFEFRMAYKYSWTILLFILIGFCACNSENISDPKPLFKALASNETNITFNNAIQESKDLNYFRYVYLYNGGGVGIGDINNDGLADIYFTSTQSTDQLYLNQGDFKFKNISESSGINKYHGYKTGVTFVDINEDGWLDIYVCRSGWYDDRQNLLFINNKDNTFKESAKEYGLNDNSRSIQASFFDFDKDNDLDVYISSHPKTFGITLEEMIKQVNNVDKEYSDKFYINNGNGTFEEVGKSVGIDNFTYGLSVIPADFNNDSWIDIYVTSDFQPKDHYYVNRGDGSFKQAVETYFPHTSYFSMGADIADLNHDGNIDLFTGEMLSEKNQRQKTNMASMDMDFFKALTENGMHYQYMRNSLHINAGNGNFSDIAQYSGIDKSDWSWSCLFGDYDMDGDDDLLIANGWLKDTQDKDFEKKFYELIDSFKQDLQFEQVFNELRSTPIDNYAFKNNSDLKFEKASDEWGFNFNGFSNGMAYGDLDNDGDLDVVVNNINDFASIYENTVSNKNHLKIKLNGPVGNSLGLNSKIYLYTNGKLHYKEFITTRGFQSSCEPIVHFGLSNNENLDSLRIIWPDGKSQLLTNIKPGTVQLDYGNAIDHSNTFNSSSENYFSQYSKSPFNHRESIFDDYSIQVLLPHKLSQLGPALAIGDIDGDEIPEMFLGGAKNQNSLILKGNIDQFENIKIEDLNAHSSYEDVEAIFEDFNNDGFNDLYVGSGSYETLNNKEELQDRIYINDGKGNLKFDPLMLPKIETCTGVVSGGDFDGDGDIDLFVGSRLSPGNYPFSSSSYYLENTVTGFVDQSNNVFEDANIGMITDAQWVDFDNDKDLDLICVGEWTDVMFFENIDSKLTRNTQLLDTELTGWWNTIKVADFDNDGDQDIVIGNLGENYKYKASLNQPFEMFAGDIDNNESSDIIVSYYNNDTLFPVRGFQCSSEQLPHLKKKIESYSEFGKSSVFDIYGKDLNATSRYKVNCFSSVYLENNNNRFITHILPKEVQLFPVQDIVVEDFDGNGTMDLLLAGNWFVSEIETSRADNGTGALLLNNGNAKFEYVPFNKSGFFAKQDVRNIELVKSTNNKKYVITANNNSNAEIFLVNDIK